MNTNNSQQLFDLVQRQDGKWVVWIRKNPVELGFVSKTKLEGWRSQATKGRVTSVTDEEYYSFATLPHNQEPVWVVHAIYESKPSIDAVLASLGVQRRQKPKPTEATAPKPRTSRAPRAAGAPRAAVAPAKPRTPRATKAAA